MSKNPSGFPSVAWPELKMNQLASTEGVITYRADGVLYPYSLRRGQNSAGCQSCEVASYQLLLITC